MNGGILMGVEVILAAFFIGIILIFAFLYVIRTLIKINGSIKYREKNEEIILDQIKSWEHTYGDFHKYSKDELFSPNRMKNGGIDLLNVSIEIVDYTSNVPWFFRV